MNRRRFLGALTAAPLAAAAVPLLRTKLPAQPSRLPIVTYSGPFGSVTAYGPLLAVGDIIEPSDPHGVAYVVTGIVDGEWA